MAETIANPTIQINANTAGLESGIASAQRSLDSMSNRASQTAAGVNRLGVSFEKLGQSVRTIGALTIAMDALARDTNAGGNAVENAATKVQAFALAIGSFAGPKGQAAALAVTGIAEVVKYLSKQMDSGKKSQEEWAKSLKETAKAVEATRKPIESLISSVERQVETFGMSREQLEMFDLSRTPAAGDRDKTRLEIAQSQRRALEEGVRMQEVAKSRAEQAAKIAESVRDEQMKENEKMIRDAEAAVAKLQSAGASSPVDSTPSILGFGSAGAFGKINELTNMRQEEMKQTDLLKEAVARLKEIVAKVTGNGTGSDLVIAQF